MKKIPRSDCPISFALDFFGDKWSLLVMRDLVFEGKRFYKEFLQSKEGIATNVLSDRLKKLEKLGVIRSQVYEKLKTQKEYSLTPKGIDLVPILVEVIIWSTKYESGLAVAPAFLTQLTQDKERVVARIKARLSGTEV
ncbi:MAG: helix-turn-helix domain-containing protein [Bacteroidota bacterium]